MREPLSQHALGRLVSTFFLGVSGSLALLLGLSFALPHLVPNDVRQPLLAASGAQTLAAGACWWFIPWERWSRRAALAALPVGTATIATMQFALPSVALVMAVFYLVLVSFVGLSQERGWPTVFAPLAAAAYAAPVAALDRWELGVVTVACVLTTSVCLLGGEVLAWVADELRTTYSIERRHESDMQALLAASTRLSSPFEASGAADLVAELAAKLLHAEATAVLLPDREGSLSGEGGWRWPDDVAALRLDRANEPLLVEAERQGHRRTLRALETVQGLGVSPVSGVGGSRANATWLLPLHGAGGLVGVVVVVAPGGRADLDRFAEDVGQTFAAQAGLALERIWTTGSLRDEALRDELTGLGNRRRAASLLARLEPGHALAMVDLDHFKLVNDTHGHPAGDAVLRSLAAYLRLAVRETDLVARYGGEEFLLVMNHASGGVAVAMERLVEGWCATTPVTTFSAGVAVHREGVSPAETLRQAESALYQAKRGGRDRWCLHSDVEALAQRP